jgi:thymidylate synthase ThyX
VTEKEEFYVPSSIEWRTAPENSKQGSGDPLSPEIGRELTRFLEIYLDSGDAMYKYALKNNVAQEQARLFLPAYSMYIRYRWTVSLASILHFLEERMKDDAQYEIRAYANAIYSLLEPLFPNVFKEIFKVKVDEPAVKTIVYPALDRAAKNESKSEYLNRMNKKIDAIVDSVRELHESNSGMWELKYNPDAVIFNYGDIERNNNDV